jgi:hypothetical protein
VYSGQRTGVIDAKPAVKIQSASASPGIAIPPRAVGEVPMPDDGSTGSGAAVDTEAPLMVSGDEEVNQGEENESWEDDDEEEVDEINHGKVPSMAIRAHSPGRRDHTSPVWTHLSRIHKHHVSHSLVSIHIMNFMKLTSFHLISRTSLKNNFINFHFTSTVKKW